MELRGRNALITGAAGGLGGYFARALAAEGVNLALSDLAEAPQQALVDELSAGAGRVLSVPADLSDREQAKGLIDRASEAVGPLDILVNSAGLEFAGPYLERSEKEILTLLEVNLTATMLLDRAVLPGMLERGRGHIVNIASLAGKVAPASLASYAASKHGVVGFSHSLRAELADTPVGVSVICPGFVARVGMYGRVGGAIDPPGPLRPIEPEQVSDAVVEAIREDRPEMIVNGRGTKVLLLLAAIAPGLVSRLSRSPRNRRFAEDFAAAKEAAPDTVAEQKVHASSD